MKKLVFNADDFGLCNAVSKGILDCYSNGLVSDFSFLINPDTIKDSLALLASRNINRCGIHFNLTMGRSAFGLKKSIMDTQGNYFPVIKHLVNYTTGNLSVEDVYAEFRLQFDLLRREGIQITHFDSHQNIHILPPVYKALKKLSVENGGRIPIRIPRESIDPGHNYRFSNLKRIMIFNVFSTLIQNKLTIEPSVHAIGGDFYNNPLPGKVLNNIIKQIKKSSFDAFECAVHPGYYSQEILQYDPYARERETELSQLKTPMDDFERNGIKICSFESLFDS